jgi:hypothetical protein
VFEKEVLRSRIRFKGKSRIRFRISFKVKSQIRVKVKTQKLCRLKNGTMEGRERSQWGLKMGPYRFCRLMDADLHHFDEDRNLDPDPDPHQSEKTGIRIRPAVEKFARYNF